jgi:site-specific recombinase XerD
LIDDQLNNRKVNCKRWFSSVLFNPSRQLTKSIEGCLTVQAYVAELKVAGAGASAINQRLAAICKLMAEAADNMALDPACLAGIMRMKGIRKEGKRLGNWLSKAQAEQLINALDTSTLKGMRDRAILAVLVGCWLRRNKSVSSLTFEQIQPREGRWVIADLVGKRNKTRSVPMPAWAKAAVDGWAVAGGQFLGLGGPLNTGPLFCRINKGDNIVSDHLSAQAVFDLVKQYGALCGLNIAPYDLRRTGAKLAHKGGAPIEQIQLMLGHISIKTTEIYLGVQQNLSDAPCDKFCLHIGELNAEKI